MSQLIPIEQFGVTEKNGKPITDSLKVSEIFNKKHQHVMEVIRNCEASEGFRQSNFRQTYYKDSQGKKQPMYEMTRDGFSFIAMGFTGKKAAKFKEDYISAFNQMESFIKNLIEAKLDFPEFTDAIMATHEEPKHYHFSNELNMINQIVTGMNAKQFKELHGIDPTVKSIRPYLESHQIETVKSLQRIDIGLIMAIPDYEQRKHVLEMQYERLKLKTLTA